MNKIAFFGPAASGKTWCANYLVDKHNFKKVGFADKVKEVAADLFGVNGKNGSDRRVLQDLGHGLRAIKEDVWINYLLNRVDLLEVANADIKQHKFERPDCEWAHGEEFDGIVLDDLRYINEADALRANGWTLIMTATPQEIRNLRLASLYPDTPLSSYYHASEQEWVDIEYDYVVESVSEDKTKQSLDKILELDVLINEKV